PDVLDDAHDQPASPRRVASLTMSDWSTCLRVVGTTAGAFPNTRSISSPTAFGASFAISANTASPAFTMFFVDDAVDVGRRGVASCARATTFSLGGRILVVPSTLS